MVEGRCSNLWDYAAAQLVLHANIHKNPKKHRKFTLVDFHPYLKAAKKKSGGVPRDRWINAVLSNGNGRR